MKKSALIIGSFTATETGFTGKLDTLASKASVTFERNEDKQKDSHPDYSVLFGRQGNRRGVGTLGRSRQLYLGFIRGTHPGARLLHPREKRRRKGPYAPLSEAHAEEGRQEIGSLGRSSHRPSFLEYF